MIKKRYILQKKKNIMHRFLWFFAICSILCTACFLPSNAHASADWEVTLRVEAGTGHNQLVLGADDTATDGYDPVWEVYAMLDGYIKAYFPHPEWGMVHDVFWRDIKAHAPEMTKEWSFIVDSSLNNYNFTIRWDLSKIPKNYEIVLIDDSTGQVTDMRSAASYSFLYTDAGLFRVAVTVPSDVIPLSPPVGLLATTSGKSNVVTLNWPANTEADIAGYNVYRSLTSGADYERLNSSFIKETSYRDTGLKKGNKYYYVVTAVNTSGGESVYSNEVEVIVAKGK